ncbi:DUF4158 domain-containing protein [Streptomyces hyaluromycini]|uniref:DUF4158 domain-containing protein n=1 Tax=Streptomyces hyaluromycini TaxID=1377993 RepID=UPI0011AE87E7|nr:DUF4158 domain-containing protein [Streptomyces hyaluromycini]
MLPGSRMRPNPSVLQLVVVRFLVNDPWDVPRSVIEHLAAQLQAEDASAVKRYTERERAR